MNYISSLISVGLITFVCFTASVQAQNCTPVVYAFWHAEDFNPPEGSKPDGGTLRISFKNRSSAR